MIDLFILILLSIAASIFAPLYFRMRSRMTKDYHKSQPISYYTKKRVRRFTMIVIFTLLIVFFALILIIYEIKSRSSFGLFTQSELIDLVLFAFAWIIMSCGVGFYISGIFVEQYSPEGLKEHPEYSRLRIATNLIHGQLSHVFIFSGGILSLLVICLFEFLNQSIVLPTTTYILYILCGIVLGNIYGWAQIKNFTWKSQLPLFLLFSLISFIILIGRKELLDIPFSIFFIFFTLTATSRLLYKYIRKSFT